MGSQPFPPIQPRLATLQVVERILKALAGAPSAGALVEPFGRLRAWFDRVDALGAGDTEPLAPADALAVARDATPLAGTGVADGEPNGLAAGDRVTVTPDDYGFDPVAGAVVSASASEIAIARRDERVGDVVVHFPRVGFHVARA